jgi:hypothetical protein
MGDFSARAVLVAVVGVPLLAACGSNLPGCASTIAVDVRDVPGLQGWSGGSAQVCLGQAPTCLTAPVTGTEKVLSFAVPDGMVPGPGVAASGPVIVSFTVTKDGATLLHSATSAVLTSTNPSNTVTCLDTAFHATASSLTMVDASTLP